jgi:hypothetical protein
MWGQTWHELGLAGDQHRERPRIQVTCGLELVVAWGVDSLVSNELGDWRTMKTCAAQVAMEEGRQLQIIQGTWTCCFSKGL